MAIKVWIYGIFISPVVHGWEQILSRLKGRFNLPFLLALAVFKPVETG
jgi:hypothetical protein